MPLLRAYAGLAAVSSPSGREEGSSTAVAPLWYAERRRASTGGDLLGKTWAFC